LFSNVLMYDIHKSNIIQKHYNFYNTCFQGKFIHSTHKRNHCIIIINNNYTQYYNKRKIVAVTIIISL